MKSFPTSVAMVDAAQLRRTKATLAVADLFCTPSAHVNLQALSHADVQQALKLRGVPANRVTLYRLLERFAQSGVLRRSVDAQRVSRFAVSSAPGDAALPHFECNTCHMHYQLADGAAQVTKAARQALKALEAIGHQGHSVELAIRGTCATCVDEVVVPHAAQAAGTGKRAGA